MVYEVGTQIADVLPNQAARSPPWPTMPRRPPAPTGRASSPSAPGSHGGGLSLCAAVCTTRCRQYLLCKPVPAPPANRVSGCVPRTACRVPAGCLGSTSSASAAAAAARGKGPSVVSSRRGSPGAKAEAAEAAASRKAASLTSIQRVHVCVQAKAAEAAASRKASCLTSIQ